ncbi:DUF3368 domain-containing protein [Caldicellulosiruptor changbaiensis]|uniref:DUF3368 domain-containing protein n=1 Tax=Caldicellulosiruptor changbaiensis TaxID=1222016 RepID=A0A3T0D7S3_9FIRM|nr:DUF3368 domain-containing protein [Caldicellulosiruptor changbaiensis]AZT91084.1 DUF3368 domain-containing protein [Caldicellulosiruptor changbaiensis]
MRKVIDNSTPIIALNSINKLYLLKSLYEKVYIPYAVYEEVALSGPEDKRINVKKHEFIVIEKIKNEEAKKFFSTSLHKGEVEVIILAKEINAELCVIDDYLARKYANLFGLKVTGTIGILIKAKEKGLIQHVKPFLDELIKNKIYIGKDLYNQILEIAKEK